VAREAVKGFIEARCIEGMLREVSAGRGMTGVVRCRTCHRGGRRRLWQTELGKSCRWMAARLEVAACPGRQRWHSTVSCRVRVEPMANRREEAEAAANDRAHRDSSGFARRGE
jgi:hypothetical protein